MIIHNIKAQYRRLVNKLFQIFHLTVYFENKYGIKSYNKIQFILTNKETLPIVDINPNEVYLSFDALKDEYTYLDTPLSESPHVEMIAKLQKGEEIGDTSYVDGELKGSLDGRYELPNKSKLIQLHKQAAKSLSQKGFPILYKLGSRYYVMDGKHRLASAFVRDEKCIRCVVVPLSTIAEHEYTQGIYKKMKTLGRSYRKNMDHIQHIMMCLQD